MTRLTERLIPDRFRDTAERERHASLLVALIVVTTAFSVFYFAVSAWVRHPPGMWAMAWQMAGFLALLPAVHAGLPLRAAGNLFVFVSYVGIGVCVAFQGGLVSPVLPWFVFPALMALFLVGPSSGTAWTLLCVAAVVVFGGIDLAGVDLPVVVDPERRALLDISSPAGLVLIVFSVAYALEKGRRLEAARVRRRNAQLAATLDELERTQEQLIQSEKLASLLTVTAGVAHEIQNPLNFVNNFAGLSGGLVDEVREALEADPDRPSREALTEAAEALDDLASNVQRIVDHGRRADGIIRGMLLTASGGSAPRVATDVNAFVEETAARALTGWLAQNGGPPPRLDLDLGGELGRMMLCRLDVEHALSNLLSNAFDAVHNRAQSGEDGFEPVVEVSTRRRDGGVEVRIADNGGGIPEADRARVFEPFYTTKPSGSGTGLGLALVHEVVVRHHGGTVALDPTEDGTVAVVTLPEAETVRTWRTASAPSRARS